MCCQLAWWKLGSPDEFVCFRQDPGLWWLARSKALHDQRSSSSFSQTQSIRECRLTFVPCCPGWSAKRGGLGHAIADGGRRLGFMLSSLCCWLYLVIVGFNDSRCLFRLFVGRINQHFENLTQDCACQTSRFFLLAPPSEKTRHVRSGNFQLQLELLGPTVHLPGELRAQPWNRQSVWNGVVGRKLGRGTPACYGRLMSSSVFDHIFQSSNFVSKFQTMPKSHISWPEMNIHGKHH